ncbi:MAG: hypothetical protein VX278_21825 [Myxococcota bacterium]|nr:hypothetical protein [Myxococcota bacterium]
MKCWFGLPEESGAFPFALRFQQGTFYFLALGLAGSSIDVMEAPDSFNPIAHGMTAIDASTAAVYLRRAFSDLQQEEWVLIETLLPVGGSSLTLPDFKVEHAKPTHSLRAPESGAYFSFGEENLKQGMAAVALAVKNPLVPHREIIEAAVDTMADMSLTLPVRLKWQLALEVIALINQQNGAEKVAALALQNAAGLYFGVPGSKIPFVRDWSEQALMSGLAMARMVEKAKHVEGNQ